jgi:tRNA-specific 2-thiouridylase
LEGEPLLAQIRYRHAPVAAVVAAGPRESEKRVRFVEPAAAVAPGQAIVLYRGDEVVGGGWIERSESAGSAA